MRVLIRNTETGFYLDRAHGWVKDIKEAVDFERAPTAILRSQELGLKNVELTYAFPDSNNNISIPLTGFNETTRPSAAAERAVD